MAAYHWRAALLADNIMESPCITNTSKRLQMGCLPQVCTYIAVVYNIRIHSTIGMYIGVVPLYTVCHLTSSTNVREVLHDVL